MKTVQLPLGDGGASLCLPDSADIYAMPAPKVIARPSEEISRVLASPIGTKPLIEIAANKAAKNPKPSGGSHAKAVIVVSDNTRPVPYRGESGLLRPVIEILFAAGFSAANVIIIVATGTHRAMHDDELRAMIDPWVFEQGITIVNHDCRDEANLVYLGTTSRGSEVFINGCYMDADLKILTGLVESHFMAGASGGRKSICPGLIGEKSTYIFHGALMMADPCSRNLSLDGNSCHEESLEVAKMAGVDFILNVTLDHSYNITGVFAGDLELAHEAAVSKMKSYVSIPVNGEYDVVVSHGGFVGVNHYQVAKVAVAAQSILKEGGHLIVIANNTDVSNPVGSLAYRTCLQLMTLVGPEAFDRLLLSKDWSFIPDQWQVQQWAKVFRRIPVNNFIYFSPQLDDHHWTGLPGVNGQKFLDQKGKSSLADASKVVERALDLITKEKTKTVNANIRIAYLVDGPYGVPFVRQT